MNEQNLNEHAVDRQRCSCSVMGFEDPRWVSTYYPVECPEDWRVAYFCNDFHSVYLSAGDWVDKESLLDAMIEEIEPGFDLILEWPAEMSLSQQQTLCARLAPLEAYIACIVINPVGVSLTALSEQLQLLTPLFPVNLEPLDNPQVTQLAQVSAVGQVWHPGQDECPVSDCAYQVVSLPFSSLREITQVLKQLDQTLTGDQRGGVFLASAPHSTQRALETRTVIELMGM